MATQHWKRIPPEPTTPTRDPQVLSGIFQRIPLEIRQSIYHNVFIEIISGVHVTRATNGEIRLSPCVGPELNDSNYGAERCTTGDWATDSVWARRLVSSWGPHWECEEILLGRRGRGEEGADDERLAAWRDTMAVLRTCRRMHLEVMSFMMRVICFNLTDLSTLDALLEKSGASSSRASRSLSASAPIIFKDLFQLYITKLGITLRLPLAVLQVFDGSRTPTTEDKSSTSTSTYTSVVKDDLRIWSELSSRIAQLGALRSLRIWIDHEDKAYWSVVNEKAVLMNLHPLASLPHLYLSFDLPKLHPQLDDPARHFVVEQEGNSVNDRDPPFKIHRWMRQRYRGWKLLGGNLRVTFVSDFPICLGRPLGQELSLADLETWERRMWRAGIDVNELLVPFQHICM